MSAGTLSPIARVVTVLAVPKTVAGALVMTPIPMYSVRVKFEVDGMTQSLFFQIQQLTPTLTIVNGEQFDEHGRVVCCRCRNEFEGDFCCLDQRTPKQVVRESPVNAHLAGAR